MRRRGIFAVAALGLAAVAFSAWARPDIRLAFNPSPSAPRGWYAVAPLDRAPQVGDHVLAWAPPWARQLADRRRYVPATVPLMKPVAAVAGARVCRTGMWVTVDGRLVAIARPRDTAGRPMPRWQGCRTLAPYELLLIAQPSGSFDGRYFGPIDARLVLARVRPLWTW